MGQFNLCFAVTWLLLVMTWSLIVFAISSPNWSHTDNQTAGLWLLCTRSSNGWWWSCNSYSDSIKNNGWVVATCALCVIGAVISFVTSCFACSSIMLGNVCWGMLLTVLSLLSYVIISIGWGMWIGAHNDIFKPAGFTLSYSFALAVGSSVVAMFAVCTSCLAIAGHKRYLKQKELEMVNAVAGAPGDSVNGHPNAPYYTSDAETPYVYPEMPAGRGTPDPDPTPYATAYPIYGSLRRDNSKVDSKVDP